MAANYVGIFQHIDTLREATAKGSVTPRMLAEILSDITTAAQGVGEDADDLRLLLAQSSGSAPALVGKPFIYCTVSDGALILHGHEKYLEAGAVPMLFRSTRKRNPVRSRNLTADQLLKKGGPVTKGLHCFGARHTLNVHGDGAVYLSTNDHQYLNKYPANYLPLSASALLKEHRRADGSRFVPWGRSMVPLLSRDDLPRSLRFRFYIAFVRPDVQGSPVIAASDIVSNLASFSVVGLPKSSAGSSSSGSVVVRPVDAPLLDWKLSR